MDLKITTSVSLSTGQSATNVIVQLYNETFKLSNAKFVCDMKVWNSQSNKDAGKDHSYIYTDKKVAVLEYTIPQDDLDQAASDGHFGIIGENHITRIKDELASLLSIDTSNIEVTSLV